MPDDPAPADLWSRLVVRLRSSAPAAGRLWPVNARILGDLFGPDVVAALHGSFALPLPLGAPFGFAGAPPEERVRDTAACGEPGDSSSRT